MSTAAKVPETWKLTGDDARKTLVETGRLNLVKDAFVRLRAADGFSHARSLAFVTSLVLVQGLVALVGFTVVFGDLRISKEVIQAIQASFPGPVGALLTDAVAQARKVGGEERYLPLLVGLVGTIVTGTTAMGQIERGFNRLYGIEQDRPVLRKYGRAFLLAMGAGTILACNFVVFTWGRGNGATNDLLGPTSPIVRWPIALLVAGLALGAMLRFAPYQAAARVVVADVRRSFLCRGLGFRDAHARGLLAGEHVLRRYLRSTCRHRRAADLDAACPRSRSSSARRSRRSSRRFAPALRSLARSRRPRARPNASRRPPTRRRSGPAVGRESVGGEPTLREA